VRRRLQEWIARTYDVVLFSQPSCYGYFGDLVNGQVIVDLDDVPDRTLARELRLEVRLAGARALLPHAAYQLFVKTVDLYRWRRLQAALAASRVWRLTCTESDRARLGTDRVMVVPNGYERSGPPLGKSEVSSPPTILMTGSFHYPPNADAVGYFIHDILPKIRRLQPGVKLAVVGSVDNDRRRAFAGCEGVELLGRVPRIEDVLARVDLLVAPFRLGGGTRIKILEAFAHRIPVVSTTIGAEGLAVRSGRELLIADSADEFARACVRVLDDRELRARHVADAYDLVEREYSWPKIRAELVRFLEREFAP
jgi:glycosyltransferase involved in cell wall biosynthesis